MMQWPWQRKKYPESADAVALRLAKVAEDLEDATAELRSLVAGLQAEEQHLIIKGETA